ncbi:MAG: ABC transporter substrate-binding protein, partial [bacterium]|nr:ABC transporter substrate-binding protein [bacterium]
KGETDFAFIQGALQEGKQANLEGLAAIATTGWQYVHILTPGASTIMEFKDLAGKRVSLGPAKSGNAALGHLVFDYFQPSAGVQLVYTDISRIKKDFQSGKMDAIFTVYDLHAPLLESIMANDEYRLVPIPEADSIAYIIPGCIAAPLPHSLYGSNRDIPSKTEAFPTLKVNTLLITSQEMDRYRIRNVLQTLYSTRFIKQSRLPELDEKKGRHVFDLPLHPAAERFYHRGDPVTSDKYEIGSAFLAFLVFLVTVVSYFVNRYKLRVIEQRRQNIVPYFEELLDYSKNIAEVDDIHQLTAILTRMMAMQRRAENQWLSGDLDTEHMENLYYIYG